MISCPTRADSSLLFFSVPLYKELQIFLYLCSVERTVYVTLRLSSFSPGRWFYLRNSLNPISVANHFDEEIDCIHYYKPRHTLLSFKVHGRLLRVYYATNLLYLLVTKVSLCMYC